MQPYCRPDGSAVIVKPCVPGDCVLDDVAEAKLIKGADDGALTLSWPAISCTVLLLNIPAMPLTPLRDLMAKMGITEFSAGAGAVAAATAFATSTDALKLLMKPAG